MGWGAAGSSVFGQISNSHISIPITTLEVRGQYIPSTSVCCCHPLSSMSELQPEMNQGVLGSRRWWSTGR